MEVENEEDFLWEKEKARQTKEEKPLQADRGSMFKEPEAIISLMYLRNLNIISVNVTRWAKEK